MKTVNIKVLLIGADFCATTRGTYRRAETGQGWRVSSSLQAYDITMSSQIDRWALWLL